MITFTCKLPKDENTYLKSAQKYFNNVWEDEWFNDPIVRQMIKDIDKTEVVGPYLMISPILGPISYRELSGGVKGLIMLYKYQKIRAYKSTIFGDNCTDWIIELGRHTDFTIIIRNSLMFDVDNFEKVDAVSDTGEILSTRDAIVTWQALNLNDQLKREYPDYDIDCEE